MYYDTSITLLALFTETIRTTVIGILVTSIDNNESYDMVRRILLALLGTIFCFGSKIGWYHSYFLPFILMVEMECGDPSILGAIDELTLVLVCAGICSATWFHRQVVLLSSSSMQNHRDEDDVSSLYQRGLYTNILCGDFIEVCYPLMNQNTIVNVGGYVASACSVSILTENCKSSAYVPLPLSIWLADDMQRMTIAACVAFSISFVFTIIGEMVYVSVGSKRSDSSSESDKED